MKQVIDLTHLINERMITYPTPWHTKVSIERLGRIEVEGRETRKIIIGTHTGTHIDAPLHFIKDGKSIEKILLDKLMGDVTIIDLSHLKENQPITQEILSEKPISKRMLFKFGWQKFWNNPDFYKNHPFFTDEAANYLVSNKVELIGYDTPSPDDSRKTKDEVDSPIHKIFLGNDIILLEYVANLNMIKNYDGWKIVVAPLKIEGADGCPARVFVYQ